MRTLLPGHREQRRRALDDPGRLLALMGETSAMEARVLLLLWQLAGYISAEEAVEEAALVAEAVDSGLCVEYQGVNETEAWYWTLGTPWTLAIRLS